MAITINQQPPEITPAYNEMTYHVSSTNIAQPNFKFVADVYVNAVKVDRLKRSQDPTFSVGVFDIHKIVESYVNHDVGTVSAQGFYKNENSYALVQVKFGEEYGSLDTGVTVFADLTNSNTIFAYAAALKEFDKIDYVAANYTLLDNTRKFLTNMPRTVNIYEDQSQWLSFYTPVTNRAHRVRVNTFDVNGDLLQTVEIENTFIDAGTDTSHRFLRVACGYNLNNVDPLKLTLGGQPIIDTSVASYTVQIKDSGGTEVSEPITFNILDDCNYFDIFEIYFQNAFGFFETFPFTRKNTKNVNIQRKEYKKNVGTLSASSFVISKQDRGFVSYFTASDETITMNSNFISEDTYTWLTELIESPQVFINVGGTLQAVTITDTAYEKKQVNNNNLINVVINIKFSQRNYRQRY